MVGVIKERSKWMDKEVHMNLWHASDLLTAMGNQIPLIPPLMQQHQQGTHCLPQGSVRP